MKKLVFPALVLFATISVVSCARGISPYEAANGKAKCGNHIR